MNFTTFKKRYQKEQVELFPHLVSSNPKVSVLVQTFNHEAFIGDCLNGILNQRTSFDFEIILGEDFSSDGTRRICKYFASKYPEKVRLLLHRPVNKIKVANTTTGNFNALYNLYTSKGEYIAFCEGDDVWRDPFKLQKQVEILESNSALALTYHQYIEVDEKLQPLEKKLLLDQPLGDIEKEDLQKLMVHPLLATVCFRNYFRDDLPSQIAEVVNMDSFLLSLLGNYGGAGFLKDIEPSLYRRHPQGLWSGKKKEMNLKFKILTLIKLIQFYNLTENYTLEAFFRERKNLHLKSLIYFFLKNGNVRKAGKELFVLLR